MLSITVEYTEIVIWLKEINNQIVPIVKHVWTNMLSFALGGIIMDYCLFTFLVFEFDVVIQCDQIGQFIGNWATF